MPWVKTKAGSKTVFIAPPEVYPMLSVTYTPNAVNKWTVEYANFGDNAATLVEVQRLMGL